MLASQEPKYNLVPRGGSFCWQNGSSGRAIPGYELVFVLRASDPIASTVLLKYAAMLTEPQQGAPLLKAHQNAVVKRMHDFNNFLEQHPDLMTSFPLPQYSACIDAQGEPVLCELQKDPFDDPEYRPSFYHHNQSIPAEETARVPDFEPLFLFRGGRDKFALQAIEFYVSATTNEAQAQGAKIALDSFKVFASAHESLMKAPDTDSPPSP